MKKFLTYLIMTVLTAGVLSGFLSGCADQANAPEITEQSNAVEETADKEANTAATATDAITAETAATDAAANETPATSTPPAEAETTVEATVAPFDQLSAPVSGEKIAVIETDMGTIKIRLFTDLAPEITKNFEELANANMFNAVPFHRVVKDFMVQTGDFTNKNGTGGYSYKGPGTMLDDEITPALKHLFGAVSMANRGPDTNGSQFFIVTNTGGTAFLDGGYSVFGQVYEGMNVALKIADLQMPGTEKPSQTVNMTNVEVMTVE